MERMQTFVNETVADLRRGEESWRVLVLVTMYAVAGAIAGLVTL